LYLSTSFLQNLSVLYGTSDYGLDQWFPTGGSRTPEGPKQHFRGSEMLFSRVGICMLLLDILFFKVTKIY